MEKIRKFQESVEPVITAALREAILAQSDTPLTRTQQLLNGPRCTDSPARSAGRSRAAGSA